MKCVLDENLSATYAIALNALSPCLECSVEHVTAYAPRGSTDLEIFEAIAPAGVRVWVTRDHHHRKPVELSAIARQGLIVFVLQKGWGSQPYWAMATNLVKWWRPIVDHASRMNPPAIFNVPWKLQGKGRFSQVPLR